MYKGQFLAGSDKLHSFCVTVAIIWGPSQHASAVMLVMEFGAELS